MINGHDAYKVRCLLKLNADVNAHTLHYLKFLKSYDPKKT